MSQQLEIWHQSDDHQDDGNKEEQGTSTAIKEEWHGTESVNTQELTLRGDASDVGEAALEDSYVEDFSQSETVGFFDEALEQADTAEPRQGTRARNVPQFFGEVRTHLVVTEGDHIEPKTVYEAKQGDDWDQGHMMHQFDVKTAFLHSPIEEEVYMEHQQEFVKQGSDG